MAQYKKLFEILVNIDNVKEMDALLHELLTPKELDDVWRRWQILNEIYKGVPQREIAERHHMSLCKITRGSKIINRKDSISRKIIEQKEKNNE